MGDAVAVAYAYINRRERTVAEVRSRLATLIEREGCTEAEADAAVTELLELGYLDDARYARLYVEDKRNLESWGAERIRRSLLERGIDRELVEVALGGQDGPDGSPPQSEIERALGLLRQRGAPPERSDRRERERAFGMLVRKGYESELAGDAIRLWLQG